VLWWGPDRQIGALGIANLARRAREFFKILSSRGGFFHRFFDGKKAVKDYT
jgi:hypothetical protein